MFEELYEPLPDVDAYLERIGIARAEGPSPALLDELIYAHQRTVPFENLDIYDKHVAPSLGKAALFEKVVTRKRGGYCFELNGLFCSLLEALGFDVQPAMARVTMRGAAHPIISHRATIVSIGGERYLADVGFGGPMPSFAPLLADGSTRSELGQTFCLRKLDEYWWDVRFTGSDGQEKSVQNVCAMPAEEQDFVAFSFYQSQNPQSVFRQNRLANIRTEEGAHDLRNSTYTEFCNGQRTSFEVEDDAQLEDLLAQKFGIVR